MSGGSLRPLAIPFFSERHRTIFTPRTAPVEPTLIAQARGAWWWNEAPGRFDMAGVRAGAKKARDAKCSGYVPSLECYSYVMTKVESGEPWLVGKRQVPFGFGWLKDGENPYRELPVRAIRIVFRELTANPDLPDAELRARLGRELFGADWQLAQMNDLFELFRVFNTDRDWSVPRSLTTPHLAEYKTLVSHSNFPSPMFFLRMGSNGQISFSLIEHQPVRRCPSNLAKHSYSIRNR